jgi:hypothetical protein
MGLADRKAELEGAIELAKRELAKLDALPDFEELAEGTVVGLLISYGPSRPYPVVALKAGDRWHLTGSNSPNKVSADELAAWLVSGGRRLRFAAVLAEFGVESVEVIDLGAALADLLGSTQNGGR